MPVSGSRKQFRPNAEFFNKPPNINKPQFNRRGYFAIVGGDTFEIVNKFRKEQFRGLVPAADIFHHFKLARVVVHRSDCPPQRFRYSNAVLLPYAFK